MDIEATLRDGKTIETFTSGRIWDGQLIGYGYHGPKKARICNIYIPVAKIMSLKVTYDPPFVSAGGEGK